MTDSKLTPEFAFGRRAWAAIGLIAVYGGVVGTIPWALGYAGKPGFDTALTVQVLMVPVLFATFYSSFHDRLGLVPVLTVTPPIATMLLLLLTTRLPLSFETVALLIPVGIVTLAFSGSWTIVGYATGTAARWSNRDTVAKRTLMRTCLWVVLGSAVVYGSYLVAVGYLVTGFGDLP